VTGGVIGRVGTGPPSSGDGTGARHVVLDGYLLPGFVDLQVNGYFGVEFQSPEADSWAAVAGKLPSTGTTSFVPTLITAPVTSLVTALRAAGGFVPGLPAGGADPGQALHPSERVLIEQLLAFPGEVAGAAERRAAHRITTYALELAQGFTAFYRDCRVIGAESEALESLRICMCVATRRTIAASLDLLGVQAPQEM